MQVKKIILNIPYDYSFSKVIMENDSYFYVPKGYTEEDIYNIVDEHNSGIRKINFIYTRVKKYHEF